jgi:hypothetical protein
MSLEIATPELQSSKSIFVSFEKNDFESLSECLFKLLYAIAIIEATLNIANISEYAYDEKYPCNCLIA